jgi:dihydroorotase-like cyclic amidohydrolase
MSVRPAEILGIDKDRGSIAVGKYADLIIWRPEHFPSHKSWSHFPHHNPYLGRNLYGQVTTVFLHGVIAYKGGVFSEPLGRKVSKQDLM